MIFVVVVRGREEAGVGLIVADPYLDGGGAGWVAEVDLHARSRAVGVFYVAGDRRMERVSLMHAAAALDGVGRDLAAVYGITFGMYFTVALAGYGLWLALRLDGGRRQRQIIRA